LALKQSIFLDYCILTFYYIPKNRGIMKSTQRVILILKLLEIGQQLKTTDIAKRFNISIRTAYRDLELLRGMRLPLRIVDGAYSLNKSAWNRWTTRNIGQAIRRLVK